MKTHLPPHSSGCRPCQSRLRQLVAVTGLSGLAILSPVSASVLPPEGLVANKTYSEWLAASWKWALETPWDGHHPLQDNTGADALRNQSGPVWFLGAGPSSSPTAKRRIVIPDSQMLYVAIGDVESSTLEDCPFCGSNEAELRASVEQFHLQELACMIDGSPVTNLEAFQVTSPMYSFTLPAQNILGIPGGGSGQSVAAGIGVIVEPFTPGLHTIYLHSTYAEDPAHSLSQMTYEITVVARPTLSIRALPGTNQLEISWPDTQGFSLEQADDCRPSAVWVPAEVDSSSLDNGIRLATVTLESDQRYFRLHFN